MDEALKQLCKMKRPELVAMAAEFSPAVTYKPTASVRAIAIEIRKRQKAGAANQTRISMPAAEPCAKDGAAVPSTAQPEPGFVDSLNAGELDTRGGPRPGAGRPAGMTDEKAKVRNLPQVPNETIVKAFEMMGGIIAGKYNCKEMGFSRSEAEALALPTTQLQEYYYPDGIPEIAWAWVSLVVTIYSVADSRIAILKKKEALMRGLANAAKEMRDKGMIEDKTESPVDVS